MKKIVYSVLATISGLVLLFSYRTSLGDSIPVSSTADAGSDATAPTAPQPSAAAPSASPSIGSSSDLQDGTYTGSSAQTRYGPVQVQVTVSGGEVTAVDVIEYPQEDRRDQQINARAVPVLVSETLDAQSADIDMVSGATFTSEGYLQSLQSALDEARA